jgi:hypothetical protein
MPIAFPSATGVHCFSKLLCGAGRRLCSGRPGHEPGLSRSKTTSMVAPGRRARTRGRPRLRTIWIEAPDGAPPRAVGAQHRQRHRGDRRTRAPNGLRLASRDLLLERVAATATGDHNTAVSDSPSHRPADQGLAGELAVSVPHGPLERERQLVATTRSLDVDELVARRATERDRSRRPPVASAT